LVDLAILFPHAAQSIQNHLLKSLEHWIYADTG
jgi:hypothetical protein